MDNKKKKETNEVRLTYYQEDMYALFAYERFISRLVKSGEKVPARVLKKFMSFFTRTLLDNQAIKTEFIAYTKEKLLENLQKGKHGFSYSYIETPIPFPKEPDEITPAVSKPAKIKRVKRQASLTDFINQFFLHFLENGHFETIISDKEKLTIYSIQQLEYYLNSREGTTISHYKKAVTIGYLLSAFDFLPTKVKHESASRTYTTYHEYLFHNVDHQYKKALKPRK